MGAQGMGGGGTSIMGSSPVATAPLAFGSGGSTPTSNAPQVGASTLPNQQVAPFTQQQVQGQQLVSGQTGSAQNLVDAASNEQLATINGAGLSQNNPYLASYFNSAAEPLTQQFEEATAPNILANAAYTGTVGSAGTGQAMGDAQTSLAEGLGNLASGLYEPAYAQGVQNQQTAAQNAGSTATNQYVPANQLNASGQTQQNQAQNVLTTNYQNLLQQANYPMQELGQLGSALGLANGGTGNSVSLGTSPSAAGGK